MEILENCSKTIVSGTYKSLESCMQQNARNVKHESILESSSRSNSACTLK